MESRQPPTIPPPPGLINALTAGFDVVANHIGVIVLPVLFDVFLWLGPHLNVFKLLKPGMDDLAAMIPELSASPDFQFVIEFWQTTNLFSTARTFPIGIFSLLSFAPLTQSPLGDAIRLDVGSAPGLISWWFGMIVFGWVIGSVYYFWVARIALRDGKESSGVIRSIFQSVFLSITWSLLFVAAMIPVFILFAILALINEALVTFAYFLLTMISLWMLVPVFFSVHGIFYKDLNAFASILAAFRIIRSTTGRMGLFLLTALIIQLGLGILWSAPRETSWFLLVGILGNAFISTALLAASFIYYKEQTVWLQTVWSNMNSRTTSAQA
jgi:hypothetical protein